MARNEKKKGEERAKGETDCCTFAFCHTNYAIKE